MKKPIVRLFAIAVAAVAVAACNNGNSNNIPGTGTNCGGPPNSMQVLYPKPGARNVTDTLANIFVSTNAVLPSGNQFNFILQASSPLAYPGTSPFFSTAASKIPSPHATPSYANPVYYAASLAQPLPPASTIEVFWNDGGTGCSPNVMVSSFSTR